MRFCEWFYISNQDTLVEHGNQYDPYCLCSNPVNPLIQKGHKIFVRIPFGNLANKFLSNGIGLNNPHVVSNYIKNSVGEYLIFYYRYLMRSQPFIIWTLLWGSITTVGYAMLEGLMPAMTDPITVHSRVEDIAKRSNTTPNIVWSLKELHAHPAIFSPVTILRELWLDRAGILALIVLASFIFFSVLNVFVAVSVWWFIVPILFLLPVFVYYARTVKSEIARTHRATFNAAPLSSRIANVNRVVHGHIHRERHTQFEEIEYMNTGTWSAAYHDVECTKPYGRKCFVWIKPDQNGTRIANLFEWKDPGIEMIPPGSTEEN
ncbi:MAG: hypothetical protein A2Z20_09075 [Bdellovibrionales bacterium RBG_16_40_8]|nr:MAG: hypothetical protein A2Z20_09075 [Bdellovibrionales bacterium RBG_16_40_8]